MPNKSAKCGSGLWSKFYTCINSVEMNFCKSFCQILFSYRSIAINRNNLLYSNKYRVSHFEIYFFKCKKLRGRPLSIFQYVMCLPQDCAIVYIDIVVLPLWWDNNNIHNVLLLYVQRVPSTLNSFLPNEFNSPPKKIIAPAFHSIVPLTWRYRGRNAGKWACQGPRCKV